MRHRRISRSPGATVFHAGGAGCGLTPAPDCHVPAANGSDRILRTRRSNEDWPAGCPLDDPSFSTDVPTASSTRKGTTAPSSVVPSVGMGKEVTARPGGAFRRAVHPTCSDRQRGQRGARRVCVVSRLAAADCFPVFAEMSSTSDSVSGCFNNPEDISENLYFVCFHQSYQ